MSVNLVVGAATGIGADVARALAERGPLLLADRDLAGVQAVADEVGAAATECDVADDGSVAQLAARVDRLGALVITAGVLSAPGPVIYAVNLVGTAKVLHALEPAICEDTVAVCFGSVAGHGISLPEPTQAILDDPLAADFLQRLTAAGVDVDDPTSAYPMTKLGVIRMARRLAPVWGARGARILSLSPGPTESPMGAIVRETRPDVVERSTRWPIARFGRPEEIASVAAFLCSDGASYMTGTDVVVDGGAMLFSRADHH